MRKFQGDDAPRVHERGKAIDEIVDIGHMGENVVGDNQVGVYVPCRHFGGKVTSE